MKPEYRGLERTVSKEVKPMYKEKFIVDSIDKVIKLFSDDKCSTSKLERTIYQIQGKMIRAVLGKKLTVIEFVNTDDILTKFLNRKRELCAG